jgi:hypothetical protein
VNAKKPGLVVQKMPSFGVSWIMGFAVFIALVSSVGWLDQTKSSYII